MVSAILPSSSSSTLGTSELTVSAMGDPFGRVCARLDIGAGPGLLAGCPCAGGGQGPWVAAARPSGIQAAAARTCARSSRVSARSLRGRLWRLYEEEAPTGLADTTARWEFLSKCILSQVSERIPGSWQIFLASVEVKGLGGCGACVGDLAGRSEDVSQIEEGVCTLAQQIALRGEGRRRSSEYQRFVMAATVGEDPGR